ncbi:MAG: hypothetical protein U1E83_01810 [Methylotetracoccus sp.]
MAAPPRPARGLAEAGELPSAHPAAASKHIVPIAVLAQRPA